MDKSEREKHLKIPGSALLTLFVVGFLALSGLDDLADAAVISIEDGLSTVFSDPKVGSAVLFELVWGSGQLVVAGLLNTVSKNPIGKIKFE